jgi:RNA polymerase sigma factor for flagellar operon FliA
VPEWTSRESVAPELERDQLILDHVPLLRHIVGRLSLDLSRAVDRDDLYGFGMLGLIAAADSWDASRGLQFSTYAYTRIRGAILDEQRRMDFLPRGRRERVRQVDAAVHRLEQAKGHKPTPEDLARELDLTVDEIDEALLSAMSAMQTSLDDGPSEILAGLLGDPRSEDPVGSIEWEEMKVQLVKAIQALPEQEQTVITLYYGEELLLKEISHVLGVTESRVSQIHSRALYRLNHTLSPLVEEGPA